MLSVNIQTPEMVMERLRDHFKTKRLEIELTQEGLAKRSGVSLGSLKRFETSGEISLRSLLKLALVLECLDAFDTLCMSEKPKPHSIDELLKSTDKPLRKRGKIK